MPVLSGVTRDSSGNPLAGVSVKVFRSDTDAIVASGTSGADGSYSIPTPTAGPFYVVAYKAGSPDIAGTTVNTIMADALYASGAAAAAGAAAVSGFGALLKAGAGAIAGMSSAGAAGSQGLTGYDVFLLAGQSNMGDSGLPYDAALDLNDPRILQWPAAGPGVGAMKAMTYRLQHADWTTATSSVGPGQPFALEYLKHISANRGVLLVPAAFGATALVNSRWAAGTGDLYLAAIAQTNAAIASGAGNTLKGILWLQGESDAQNNVSQSSYQTALDAVIAGFRSGITGASNAPFVVLGMVPEYLAANAQYGPINSAHVNTPSRNYYSSFVAGPTGTGLNIHYDAPRIRLLGVSAYQGLLDATANVPSLPGQVTSLAAGSPSSTSVPLTWTAPSGAVSDYMVQYRVTGAGSWTTFAHTASATTGITVSGLVASTAYDFQVAAINAVGTGPFAASVTATTTAAPSAPLIDAVNTAAGSTQAVAAAYSTRKLRSAYAGSAIQVRRSSDNTTQDIGFDGSGNLNTSALTAFVGSNSGFISKWYDQSGNGKDATQATAANQPSIMNSGTMVAVNAKAALNWPTASAAHALLSSTGFPLSSDYTIASVTKALAGAGNVLSGTYFGTGGHAMTDRALVSGAGAFILSDPGASNTTTPETLMATAVQAGGAVAWYRDGTVRVTGTGGTTVSDAAINIGNLLGSNSWHGEIAEAIVWSVALGSAARAAVQSSQQAYWGTA